MKKAQVFGTRASSLGPTRRLADRDPDRPILKEQLSPSYLRMQPTQRQFGLGGPPSLELVFIFPIYQERPLTLTFDKELRYAWRECNLRPWV